MAEVAVEGVTKRFGSTVALDDVTLTFSDGGFFGLLGPSGSGKTTLLRAIAGFNPVDAGHIRIGGQPVERVPVEKRDIGMMFQSYALFPNMTVADNIGFGLRVRKVSRQDERARVNEALDLVQLPGLGHRKPHELSGGQRQRVALARAFVTGPKVLLLDEPLSALDKALRVDMQVELKRIQRELGITTIFVTHDQEEALTLSDRVGILKEGRLVQEGTPRELYNAPASVFAARFLGEANILPPPSAGDRIARPAGPGEVLAVRPENLRLSAAPPDGERMRARVAALNFAGATATAVLVRDGVELKATGRDRALSDFAEGDDVWLGWAGEDAMRLPDDGDAPTSSAPPSAT